ncbi:MAG: ribonucleotide-diphosphate reductase subunit beta, partial [Proteobacteria bacterium]|nr:ribonucleotide-diphosphate reductase subunit beta [Pseudomonadota bacterium]
MLTWDDEVKPSSQILLDGSLKNGRPVESPSPAFNAPALQPVESGARHAPAAAAAQHRRVSAVDKRIING